MNNISLLWMRRNLRLEDNRPMSVALSKSEKILPIFIFDPDILARFNNKSDRRLSFLVATIFEINKKLRQFGGQILIFHGKPKNILPKLAKLLDAKNIYADQDFEPDNIKRDKLVKQQLTNIAELEFLCDHLLLPPDTILNQNNLPYKVYTPYMRAFRRFITKDNFDFFEKITVNNEFFKEYVCDLSNKLLNIDLTIFESTDLVPLNIAHGQQEILKQIGYIYQQDNLWIPQNVNDKLSRFIENKLELYKEHRDFLAIDGTSAISPYLRFGLISIRKCYRLAFDTSQTNGNINWVNELIWREFYAMILYHFPEIVTEEFQEKYRHKIPWKKDYDLFKKFTDGQTGFPIIDAAINQLVQDGWMHNRARMIVASFLTKNIFIDWRMGEEFFAQYLMDYDLASNIGGWQFASSCGTDAQPYFRIFNPFTQGKNFDNNALYVKKYLPDLQLVNSNIIHDPNFTNIYPNYPKPIIDYQESRRTAIEIFKNI